MAKKTTIEIEDDLLVAAKRHAAERRTTLRTLVERGLRSELREGSRRKKRAKIKWVTVAGGLPPGLDVRDRTVMAEWIRRR